MQLFGASRKLCLMGFLIFSPEVLRFGDRCVSPLIFPSPPSQFVLLERSHIFLLVSLEHRLFCSFLFPQNQFHLQISARVPPSSLGSLLLDILQGGDRDRDRGHQESGSWGAAAVICPGWDEGSEGLLAHLKRHSGAVWHLWDIINLTRITGGRDRSKEKREDQMEKEALNMISTSFLRSPSPVSSVLLLGSDLECLSSVLRVAQHLTASLPALQWIMGYPLSPDSLHTLGGPLGLLAYGEIGRKPISFYIRDSLQLIVRAVTAAAMLRPDEALVQNILDCYNKPNQLEVPSSGHILARYEQKNTRYMQQLIKGSIQTQILRNMAFCICSKSSCDVLE